MHVMIVSAAARHYLGAVRLNPAKLLLSKWTATVPCGKEKHFIVTHVVEPEAPAGRLEFVELEAAHSRRSVILRWCQLTDCSQWLQGRR